MKVIILVGGLGTRISEETSDKPKPMVNIDGNPILWHLMNIFAIQGFREFILALGYRGDVVKRWLVDFNDLQGDIVIDTGKKSVKSRIAHEKTNWLIHALDTGLRTQTGGRIKKCMQIFSDETIIATYGDGLANINLKQLISFHNAHGRLATVTAVRPPARFGYIQLQENGLVRHFGEKNQIDEGWINGGFFILNPKVADLIHSEDEPFETGALMRLVEMNQLMAYQHEGFWQPMDTLREKNELDRLAKLGAPPWLDGL